MFYVIYSARKISFAYQKRLYETVEKLSNSTYSPIMIHYMNYLFDSKQYQAGLFLGNKIYQKAILEQNDYLLYEYYESIITYYIFCEQSKIEETEKYIEEVMNRIDFPKIKKLEHYRNLAKRCIVKQNYQKALNVLRMIQTQCLHKSIYDRIGIILNITFCESQLYMPYSIAYDYVLKLEYFDSKADFYLFQYLLKKKNMTNVQKVRYLHKVAKSLQEHDIYTKFQITEELYLISNKDKKVDLFRYLRSK